MALDEGSRVAATVRSSEHAASLRARGVEAHAFDRLDGDVVRVIVREGARVVVSFPPDGETDAGVAPALDRASSIVYVSTTSVYGARRGEIDETTPVDPDDAAGRPRLAAEQAYLAMGATVLRAAGIYGEGRGLHRRVRDPSFRLRADGAAVVSRIHVEDLARIALRAGATLPVEAAARRATGKVFVVADDCPVPQIDAVRWLCARLGLPMPAGDSTDFGERARHVTPPRASRAADRTVRNHRVKQALSLVLRFPSFREGFEACLRAELDGVLDAPRAAD